MTLPIDLVFVRHGQSVANVIQGKEKNDPSFVPPASHGEQHDWHYRLSEEGRRQAQKAGSYFDGGLAPHFDIGYVSPFMRTRETASLVGGPDFRWLIDDRLKERDWGTYGTVPLREREEAFPRTEQLKVLSAWYTQFDNGESLASGVLMRVRDFLGTLHRERSDERVIVVTHGEFMWTARYVLERMLPEEWEELDKDKSRKIRNCTLLEYTRRDPVSGELAPRIGWRRMRYTDYPDWSPDKGEWVALGERRTFSGAELAESVEAYGELKADLKADLQSGRTPDLSNEII